MTPTRRPSGTRSKAASFDRSYQALTFRFSVQTELPRGADLVRRFLAPFQTDGPTPKTAYGLVRGPKNGFMLTLNGRIIHGSPSLAGLLDRFLWEVHRQAIRRNKRYLLVHAATASWKGTGIVMPAASGSGKSTLVAGLTRAGFAYLSDEAAAIDLRTAEVHPYPRVLSLESESVEVLPDLQRNLPPEYRWRSRLQYHFTPDELRPRAVGPACQIGFVIAVAHEAASTTLLERISRADALYRLAENSFNLSRFKARGLRLLAQVVERAECYRLRVGDLGSAVEAVRSLVA